MKVEIQQEMYDQLIAISKELNSQNHRGTAMPYIFQIQDKEQVPAAEGNGIQGWVYDGSLIHEPDEIRLAIYQQEEWDILDQKEANDKYLCLDTHDREDILEKAGYREVWFDYKETYQNAFFTSKACDEHIARNRHHYTEPVNYLSHAFRNPEMEVVLKFLCELTGGEIHK